MTTNPETASTFTTTAADVLEGVDLRGRTVAITGATSGLGLESARSFARAGADVVLIGRDPAKLDSVRTDVVSVGAGSVSVERADLADLDSVAELGEALGRTRKRLDILITNAGVMAAPLQRSPQGHEMQLAVSHLGHHRLITRLTDLLGASGGRVVMLSSNGHWLSPFDLDDPDFLVRDYDKWGAYGQAKSAVTLSAIAMAERFGADGITSVSVHPGVIKTELQRHLPEAEEQYVLGRSQELGELRTAESGAASIVWAAIAPEVADHNGAYIQNCGIANEARAPHASDPAVAQRVWDVTESLIAG